MQFAKNVFHCLSDPMCDKSLAFLKETKNTAKIGFLFLVLYWLL